MQADRWDEKAKEVVSLIDPASWMETKERIEKALRSAYADGLRAGKIEAFEEAAKRASRAIRDGSECVEELPNELECKAVIIRAEAGENK